MLNSANENKLVEERERMMQSTGVELTNHEKNAH